MKQYNILLSVILLTFGGCYIANDSSSSEQRDRDGTSFSQAVVLTANNHLEGIAKQQEWIDKNLPGSRPPPSTPEIQLDSDTVLVTFERETIVHEGRLYRVISLQLPNGQIRDVYFDITGYFGKGSIYESNKDRVK